MFESVRKHQRILQLVLVILVFPAFAFFGIQGYDRFFSGDDAVAQVGEWSVSRQEYDQARQRQLEQLRQTLGSDFDQALLDSPQMRAEVLEGLVTQRALMSEALRQRVAISDEAVRRTILEIPDLVKPDGSFDMERYRSLLASQGRNEAMFESELRRDLTVQALPGAIAETILIPDALVERVTRLGEQQREVRRRAFLPKDFVDQVDVSDAALRRFYDENVASFDAPEQAKVEYVVLNTAAIEKSVQLNPDEVRAYYEQNRTRYVTVEQRRASHILISTPDDASADARKAAREKAEALRKRVIEGEDFAVVAKTESQDSGSAAQGGDLGFFSASMMAKPFADAAFALNPGDVSEVVESEFGFHIIKVTEIRPGTQRPFDTVRAEIEAEIRKQHSAGRFAEAAETFSNIVYEQPDSLEPVAQRFGLHVQTAEQLRRDGLTSLPREHPLNNEKLLALLFSPETIRARHNTEAIDVGGGALVSARVIEHTASHRREFEVVRELVREQLLARQSQEAARKAGLALLQKLRDQGAADADMNPAQAGEASRAAAEQQASANGFGKPYVTGRAPSATVPQAAIETVFRVDATSLPGYAGADLGEDGFVVYQIAAVIEASAKVLAERKPAYRQQLEQAYAQSALQAYVGAVKGRTKIERNLAAITPASEDR